jgi:hypothetical protein
MRNANALTQALVAPPGRLSTPKVGVGMPKPLPSTIPFGNLQPSITTRSQYTGGRVPGSSMNLVHPPTPQTFQAPTYTAPTMTGVAPHLAPIVQALMATGTTPTGPTGATAPRLPIPSGSAPPPTLGPYQPQGVQAPRPPSPTGGAVPSVGGVRQIPLLGSVLAGLAQQGRKATSFQIGRVE